MLICFPGSADNIKTGLFIFTFAVTYLSSNLQAMQNAARECLGRAGSFSLAEFCHIKLYLDELLDLSYGNWLRKLMLFRLEKGRPPGELIAPSST